MANQRDPPPPYEEAIQQPPQHPSHPYAPEAERRFFPQHLNLYKNVDDSEWYILGEHRVDHLYRAIIDRHGSVNIFELNPAAWLAKAINVNPGLCNEYEISIPREHESITRTYKSVLEADPPLDGRGSMLFRFRMTTGLSIWGIDDFEWQRCNRSWSDSGGHTELLDTLGEDDGWRLVYRNPGNGGAEEVLAVCARDTNFSYTKFWRFAFLGRGTTDAWGKKWEIMVVLTGLAVCANGSSI